jgi:hypothetical protein
MPRVLRDGESAPRCDSYLKIAICILGDESITVHDRDSPQSRAESGHVARLRDAVRLRSSRSPWPLHSFASSIQAIAGRVDNAHVGVSDASVTHVGAADDRRAAGSLLGPSTGGRGEQAQPGCLDYAVPAERGLRGDIGVPARQASSAALTLSCVSSAARVVSRSAAAQRMRVRGRFAGRAGRACR